MTHNLKCLQEYFQPLIDGRKTFEIRREDDREFPFAEGDNLQIRELDTRIDNYSGRSAIFEVTYILRDKPFVPDGYVVLGIKRK